MFLINIDFVFVIFVDVCEAVIESVMKDFIYGVEFNVVISG